jgi:hypothetical protein
MRLLWRYSNLGKPDTQRSIYFEPSQRTIQKERKPGIHRECASSSVYKISPQKPEGNFHEHIKIV